MQIELTEKAAATLTRKGRAMTIDFIRPTG